MTKQLFIIKENKSYIDLLNYIFFESQSVVSEIGESVENLQFARKKLFGYSFIEKPDINWQILNKIAYRIHNKDPYYRLGHIVDELSHRVNTTVSDEAVETGEALITQLNKREINYLNSLLVVIDPEKLIPRFPWMHYQNKKRNGVLIFKDLLTGKQYCVKKKVKNGFVTFNFFRHKR